MRFDTQKKMMVTSLPVIICVSVRANVFVSETDIGKHRQSRTCKGAKTVDLTQRGKHTKEIERGRQTERAKAERHGPTEVLRDMQMPRGSHIKQKHNEDDKDRQRQTEI